MEPINVHEYERLARERLSAGAWAYYSSGADDEVTLREERAAFERLRLLPRVLQGVADADLRTTVLGASLGMLILVAPTALHALAHPDGVQATARAAGEAGTLMALSTVATRSLERSPQSPRVLYGSSSTSTGVRRSSRSGWCAGRSTPGTGR